MKSKIKVQCQVTIHSLCSVSSTSLLIWWLGMASSLGSVLQVTSLNHEGKVSSNSHTLTLSLQQYHKDYVEMEHIQIIEMNPQRENTSSWFRLPPDTSLLGFRPSRLRSQTLGIRYQIPLLWICFLIPNPETLRTNWNGCLSHKALNSLLLRNSIEGRHFFLTMETDVDCKSPFVIAFPIPRDYHYPTTL